MRANKRRKRRKNKALSNQIHQMHGEMIDNGLIEELPGGRIRWTPAGIEENKRIIATDDYKLFASVIDKTQDAKQREQDLQIKQAILQTTRRIVG